METRGLVVLLAYVAGVVVASLGDGSAHWARPLALAVTVAGLVAVLIRRRLTRLVGEWVAAAVPLVSLVSCAWAAGAVNTSQAWEHALRSPLRALGTEWAARDAVVTIEGRLQGDAEPTESGARLLVGVTKVVDGQDIRTMDGTVAVSVAGNRVAERLNGWRGGRLVRLPVSVRAGQRYRNPGVADPATTMALRGIAWRASAKSALLVEVLDMGSAFDALTARVRAHARRWVRRAFESVEPRAARDLHAAIVVAVLIGDRSGLPADVAERLQRAGTFHVIAISGGNIAILTALVTTFLRWTRVGPRLAAALTLVAIGSYGLVASGSPSVSRAALVAVLYLAGRTLDLRPNGFAVLWAAVLALLVWSPLALFDPGFLLTVVATIAVMGFPDLMPRHEENHLPVPVLRRVWRMGFTAIAATLAADILLLPIAATAFSQVTVAGVVLNLLAIPLMTIGQVAGLAIVIIGPFVDTLATVAAHAASAAVGGLLESAALVDRVPGLAWRVPPPPTIAVVAYYATWCGWALGRHRCTARAAWVLLTMGVTTLVWIALAPIGWPSRAVGLPDAPDMAGNNGRNVLAAVFLDVGQGDATLLRFPSGRAWLVDAGGTPGPSTFDVGSRVVVPAVWALGVRALDVLAVTHPDPDHAGGAIAAVGDLGVGAVWEGVPVEAHPVMVRLRERAARRGSLWRRVERGERQDVGGVRVAVLHPSRPDWERRRARNDDSITLLVEYGGVRLILPGDIGAAIERSLADDLRRRAAAITVLKVAHHGSAGSSSGEWLAAVRPSLAIVSAGRANPFGHPAPAAVARLEASGARVFGTHQRGALAMLTDGRRVELFAWEGRNWVLVWKSG